ncbi:hypothetical protein Tco_0172981 [Tanacetum coccineum]
MAALKYREEHNKVGYLEKPKGSDDYHQVLDFLRGSHFRYALTHDPIIFDSLVKQFWSTASLRAPELGSPAILATIDRTPYTITEDTVRRQLQLGDDGGIEDLPIADIYLGMDNLGYPTEGKLTFHKNKFSPQWRFLVHTIQHCLSSKSGSWDQFGSPLAIALICLSDGRRFNWSRYIFKGMVHNISNAKRFLMYPRFLQIILGIETRNTKQYHVLKLSSKLFANMRLNFNGDHMPLLAAMLPPAQAAIADEGTGEVAPDVPQTIPETIQETRPEPDQSQEHLPTPPRTTTTDQIPPVFEQGHTLDPNIASFSGAHESDPDLFTSTNVEDATLGGSFLITPPRSSQVPPEGPTSGGAEDLATLTALSSLVSELVQKVSTLESELQAHKLLFKEVVGTLVKKVKALELKLNTRSRKVVMSESDTEEEEEQDVDPLIKLAKAAAASDDHVDVSPGADVPPSLPHPTSDVPITEVPTNIPFGGAPTRPSTISSGSTTVPTSSSVPAADTIPAKSGTTPETPSSPVRDARKGKGVVVDEPTPTYDKTFKQLEEERLDVAWDIILARLQENPDLSSIIFRVEFTDDDFAARMVELVNTRRKELAEQRAQERRERPMTPSQLRQYMRTYVKNQGPVVYSTGWTMAQVQKLSPEQLQEEFDKIQRAVAFTRGLKRYSIPMSSASSKKLKTGDDEANVEALSHGVPQEEESATPSRNVSREEVAAPPHSQDLPAAQVEVSSQKATIEDVDASSNLASTTQHTASSLKKVGTKKKRLGRKGVHTSQSTIPIEEGDPEAEHKVCIKYASDADSASDDDTPVNLYVVVDWELLPTGLGSINAFYRLDNSRKYFTSLREILHLVTRADLMTIYGRVMTFYQDKKAAGAGLVLWGDLKVLMDSPEVNDGNSWWTRFTYVCGQEVSYLCPSYRRMLDHQLEICHGTVGNELTTAVQLIAFLKKQISDSKCPKVHDCGTTPETPSSPLRDARKGKGVAVEEPTLTYDKTSRNWKKKTSLAESHDFEDDLKDQRKETAGCSCSCCNNTQMLAWGFNFGLMVEVGHTRRKELAKQGSKIRREKMPWDTIINSGNSHCALIFKKSLTKDQRAFAYTKGFKKRIIPVSAQVEVLSQKATVEDVDASSNLASTAQPTTSSLKKVRTKKKQLGRKGVHTSQSTIPIEEGDPKAEHKVCIKYASDADYAFDDDTPVNLYAVIDWELLPTGLGSINAFYRLDNSRKYFISLREIRHLVTRAYLMTIYGRVMTFYQDKKVEGVGLVLWGDLKVLMDSPETVGGLVLHMFLDKKYPLSVNLIKRMLDHQLEICHGTVGNELTTTVQLIAFLKKQISNSKRPKVTQNLMVFTCHILGMKWPSHATRSHGVNTPWDVMRIVCNPDLMDIMLLQWFFDAASSWNFEDSTLLLLVQGFTVRIHWLCVSTSVKSQSSSSQIVTTSRYVVPTGRVKVHAGRYVVPTSKDNVIVSAGRTKCIPAGRTILVLIRWSSLTKEFWICCICFYALPISQCNLLDKDGNKTRTQWGPDIRTCFDRGIPELTGDGDGDGDGESPILKTGMGAGMVIPLDTRCVAESGMQQMSGEKGEFKKAIDEKFPDTIQIDDDDEDGDDDKDDLKYVPSLKRKRGSSEIKREYDSDDDRCTISILRRKPVTKEIQSECNNDHVNKILTRTTTTTTMPEIKTGIQQITSHSASPFLDSGKSDDEKVEEAYEPIIQKDGKLKLR